MRLFPEAGLLPGETAPLQSARLIEILDFHDAAGAARLRALWSTAPPGRRALTPFLTAVREIRALRRHFGGLVRAAGGPDALPGWLADRTAHELRGRGLAPPQMQTILRAVHSTGILSETAAFAAALVSPDFSNEQLERNARWIHLPSSARVFKYVGVGAHRLLAFSRLLGLIRFDTVQRLRTARVRSMGASVAASTLDLLVALGSEDIAFADPGVLETSNLPRMPGGMGSVAALGRPKAIVLAELLYARNPYGTYRAIVAPLTVSGGPAEARVPKKGARPRQSPPMSALGLENRGARNSDEPPAGHRSESPASMELDEFLSDADMVLEVVDQVDLKVVARERMAKIGPHVPLLFLTDAGSDPSAGMELGIHGTVFGQRMGSEERAQLRARSRAGRFDFCAAEYALVRGHVPLEAALQLMFAGLGVIPFWSQTPISARESAALGTKLWLERALLKSDTPQVVHLGDAPTSLLGNDASRVPSGFWPAFDQLFG